MWGERRGRAALMRGIGLANPQRNNGMTLKKAVITRQSEPRDSDPRRCQQAAAPTMREARGYYLFVIVLLAVAWGIFVVGLFWLFKETRSLENLWMGQANLTEFCIEGEYNRWLGSLGSIQHSGLICERPRALTSSKRTRPKRNHETLSNHLHTKNSR